MTVALVGYTLSAMEVSMRLKKKIPLEGPEQPWMQML